ncbi:ornithine carbamoyltransferase [Pacificimonas flava]|uniref:Ornithine carbamoyltransferase n=2 Tax=Pacificimonas TaxID=1960290 RepID=A0A219B142_9SPHN|nr:MULTISPECIES: ornithine carbamoyltransferase [Pacificimonas]MBZ6379704.1 ornithine carbamoyltransferase [Pacificimonas aurantium]OWV31836.1 ornithine carbamoyltransferase [Pacificimonas flava]
MPHFLDLEPLGPEAVRKIVDEAHRRKAARAGRPKGGADDDAPLDGHVLASIFEKTSTRTRLSFEMAMRQLGGSAITMATGDMQIGIGETIEDTARVLSRFVDVVQLRTDRHDKLLRLAEKADVPVINGLTDDSHPCQILADVMTVEERRGAPVETAVWAWLGDGNNVCQSLIEAAGLFGFTLRLSVPAAYDPDPAYAAAAEARGGKIDVVRNPLEAAHGADVVVTDTWVSMGDKDRNRRLVALSPYQVTEEVMAAAAPDATFLHCLPAHRGEEVVDAVIDGPNSAVFDEAENRVHAQKAILLWCLGKL